ncbi:MAG TPA: hypothetical protein PLT82_05360 [Candidatus Hydrogenedens sp.]|nr:hypothetical protein [Candidatus Hydrogenedens sp.]HPP58542.1 hypothetical protein [Candidatus Hydrogenedens sp.]
MEIICKLKDYIWEKINYKYGEYSEIDTEIIFVEPILYLAGYDIFNLNIVKRAKRSGYNTNNVDIKINNGNKNPLFLIEVKSTECLNKIFSKFSKFSKNEYGLPNNTKNSYIILPPGEKGNYQTKTKQSFGKGKRGDLLLYISKKKSDENYDKKFLPFDNDWVGQILAYGFNQVFFENENNHDKNNLDINIESIEELVNNYESHNNSQKSKKIRKEIIEIKNPDNISFFPILTDGKSFIFFDISKFEFNKNSWEFEGIKYIKYIIETKEVFEKVIELLSNPQNIRNIFDDDSQKEVEPIREDNIKLYVCFHKKTQSLPNSK